MGNLADYFERKAAELPKSKYESGARVFGHWNKIPVIGSVFREEKQAVLIYSDLPVKHNDVYQTVLTIPIKDVKLLTTYDDIPDMVPTKVVRTRR
jgi:hypothetical protein